MTKLRSLVALGTLISSVAGYFGYDKYFSDGAGGNPEVAASGDDSDAAPSKQVDSADDDPEADPFETAAKSEAVEDPQAPANSEPRRMRHVPNAAPIASNHGAGHRLPKKPTRNSLDDDALDIESETEIAPPRMTQAEPETDDDDLNRPSLEPSSNHSRRAGAPTKASAGHAGNHHPSTAANRAREFSGGPRIVANQTRGEDPIEEISDDLSDDRLEGYRVAQPKHQKPAHGNTGNHHVSVIDVSDEEAETDERFEGYSPDNPTSRRAVARTRVVRPTEGTSQRPPAAGIGSSGSRRSASTGNSLDDDDYLEEAPKAPQAGRGRDDLSLDDDSEFNRPSQNGMTPIRRRGSPPLPSAGHEFKARRQMTDEFSQNQEPADDVYRVLPEDNFWRISRKQYGSARYFQALTRHNQDRVPDPTKLRPGTEISTPSVAYLEKRYPDLIEKSSSAAANSGLAENRGTRPRFERPVAAGSFDDAADRKTDSESTAGYFYNRSGAPMYRIGSDDTLTGIAQKHLGRASRWTEIYDQNRDVLKSPNDLTLGTVIRLPDDASRLSLVPDGDRRR